MKKVLLGLLTIICLCSLTGCKKGSVEGNVKALLNELATGDTDRISQAAIDYTSNPNLLVPDANGDTTLRNAIFARMSYKILDVKEYEKEAVVKVRLKTLDVPHIVNALKKDLEDDSNYTGLAGEAKEKYYFQKYLNVIQTTKKEDDFRTKEIELNLVKDGSNWKITISSEFYSVIAGQQV